MTKTFALPIGVLELQKPNLILGTAKIISQIGIGSLHSENRLVMIQLAEVQ